MNTSDQINELVTALSKAQGEIKNATKDSENPHFRSSYADLASVWDSCRGPLSKNGLSVVQAVEVQDGRVLVDSMLAHASGQWFRSHLWLTPRDQSPQSIGSCATYGRRYSLMGLVGIAPEEIDDDGNAASIPRAPQRPQAAKMGPVGPKPSTGVSVDPGPSRGEWKASPADLAALMEAAKKNNWMSESVKSYMDAKFQKSRLSLYSKEEYDHVMMTVSTVSHTDAMASLDPMHEKPFDFEKEKA